MKTNVTTSIVLVKRRKRKDGLFPVKIRVTHNRYSKYYSINYALSSIDFDKVMGRAPRMSFKSIRKSFIDKEEEIRNIISDIDEFTFEEFDSVFLNGRTIKVDVFTLFDNKIEELHQQSRIRTSQMYYTTLTAIKLFSKKESLQINKITVKFLEDFEQWMITRGKSITTVGIYCRNIRTIFNDAISDGIVKQEKYPFGRRKYQIPTGRSIKKALTKNDIFNIINYQPKKDIEAYSRDMWMFSYLANGMNFTDIANLTFKNVIDDFLVFSRSKTRRSTRSKPNLIRVFILDQMHEIIIRWGNKQGYIFPILKKGMTAEKQVSTINLAIRSINHHINKIAKMVGIEKKVTTYTARHSYSTVLKRSGASIEYISESLGHSSIITTKHYLDSFEDIEKRKWSAKLL